MTYLLQCALSLMLPTKIASQCFRAPSSNPRMHKRTDCAECGASMPNSTSERCCVKLAPEQEVAASSYRSSNSLSAKTLDRAEDCLFEPNSASDVCCIHLDP